MALAIALVTAAVMTWTMWRYCLRTIRGEAHPVAASWIISSTTMTISFLTYWSTPGHSLVANIGNVTGVNAIITVIVILVVYYRRSTLAVSFTRFQWKCMIASGLIIVFWKASAPFIGAYTAAVVSNVATQVLMLVSYTTIAERLWKTGVNNEPLDAWYGILTGSMLALVAATLRHDWLAILYAGRWFGSVLVIMWLMLRIERKKRLAQMLAASTNPAPA